jgi:hypothetical protein
VGGSGRYRKKKMEARRRDFVLTGRKCT